MKETACAKNKEPKPGCFRNVFAVWFRSSRCRQASKCKLHIQSLQCSVKIHRRRRDCMVKQSRSDVAKLLDSDRLQEARRKTRQIYEDEKMLSAYDQVDYFCTSILQNFSPLDRQSDVHLLPEETKEAMAGLIFAASRIGELKELQIIRSLFVQRFGLGFDKDCVDLRPGHLVSSEIVKILETKYSKDAFTPENLFGIFQNYQTNSTTTNVDSITEDSASRNDHGIASSDTAKKRNQRKL
ncbi:hypothetical protein BRARA_A03133 [Brassica rapa]|uniref:Uncharacterized protein n=2 Tax=Brassica campestris TaxID=3711 RepID=A0A398ASA5_BRACM|nr:hypothetical protein IGI04_003569 [Brassica rapa subsp. trilocularis]RID80472.1 hypothetical protein BRARA_A03133 [Brassica rapa]